MPPLHSNSTSSPTETERQKEMGCASSALLNRDDDFSQIGSSAFGHHIVSLTSTTYGLLTLDSPPATKKNNATATTMSPPAPAPSPSFSSDPPEVINSWELMAGLDTDSFRFTTPTPKSPFPRSKSRFAPAADKENSNPNTPTDRETKLKKEVKDSAAQVANFKGKLSAEAENKQHEEEEEKGVVIYTTTLRGVRKTFEACNAVRAAIQGLGLMVCERDVSMDRGFKEELRALMVSLNKTVVNKETLSTCFIPLPQVFVNGKLIGGAEEVLRLQEEGGLHELLQGLPRVPMGYICDGCGGVRFLPCFTCYGSCKMVVSGFNHKETVVVRCPDCNENGLVLCPICC